MSIPSRWRRDLPLASLTTWRIGGPARFFSTPTDIDQLRADLSAAQRLKLPVFALGGGSNLLFSDAGYAGLILCPPPAPAGPPEQPVDPAAPLVRLAAGAPLASEGRRLALAGLGGLHWAEGIPGTIGGAIVNNAGAHGGTVAQTLRSAQVVLPDGSLEERPAADLELAYRSSLLKHRDPTEAFVVSGLFRLSAADPADLAHAMQAIRSQRAGRFPTEPSCGCVFRNPPDIPAGRLIEELGLAGRRFGGLQVSPQHANFIVNTGDARATDALEAIRHVRGQVLAETGIRLELEIQLVGFGSEADLY